jgi:hypothetical protein
MSLKRHRLTWLLVSVKINFTLATQYTAVPPSELPTKAPDLYIRVYIYTHILVYMCVYVSVCTEETAFYKTMK